MRPDSTASLPNDGPTIASSIIRAGAGSFPDLRIFDKSLASFIVKFPVICDLPLKFLLELSEKNIQNHQVL